MATATPGHHGGSNQVGHLEEKVEIGIGTEVINAAPFSGYLAAQVRDLWGGALPLIMRRGMDLHGFIGMALVAGFTAFVSRQGLVGHGRGKQPALYDHHPDAQ